MTIEECIEQLQGASKEFKRWFDRDLPREIGVEAVNFFTESFDNQGFTDNAFEPWKEVKRRENERNYRTITRGRNAGERRAINRDSKDKILDRTGNLKKSLEYDAEPGQVTVISDTEYSSAHNEGTTTAGRNHNVTIPKRQFMGESETFDDKVVEIMEEGADRILKK
ncbi:MAG: phage virion morphogenesis protein [Lentimicrobiaceae bacterium]|nr:phage virion morphogenesis protein [Lentimicrobiaceae bacterium]